MGKPQHNMVQTSKELWKPKLSDYMNFDNAWASLKQQVPAKFFVNPLDLPLADKIAGLIFIGCGLSIAYLFELEREGIQLVSFEEANRLINALNYNPMHGLHQRSLNI